MYGAKRGIRAPGEFGMGDKMGLALASASGIIAALVTDYQQKGDAAALFKINEWAVAAGSILGFTDIPLWMVALGLTVVGAGSIFYFQPITRQGAFAQGFGLLAVLLTMVPPNLDNGLPLINDFRRDAAQSASREAALGPQLINAAYTTNAQFIPVQNTDQNTAMYDVHLFVNFEGGIDGDISDLVRRGAIRGKIHNQNTGQTYNLFRSAGGTIERDGENLRFHVGVPARADQARLWVRIECIGHRIEEQSAVATLGERLDWTVEMQPSSTPLFVQRLNRSYWF